MLLKRRLRKFSFKLFLNRLGIYLLFLGFAASLQAQEMELELDLKSEDMDTSRVIGEDIIGSQVGVPKLPPNTKPRIPDFSHLDDLIIQAAINNHLTMPSVHMAETLKQVNDLLVSHAPPIDPDEVDLSQIGGVGTENTRQQLHEIVRRLHASFREHMHIGQDLEALEQIKCSATALKTKLSKMKTYIDKYGYIPLNSVKKPFPYSARYFIENTDDDMPHMYRFKAEPPTPYDSEWPDWYGDYQKLESKFDFDRSTFFRSEFVPKIVRYTEHIDTANKRIADEGTGTIKQITETVGQMNERVDFLINAYESATDLTIGPIQAKSIEVLSNLELERSFLLQKKKQIVENRENLRNLGYDRFLVVKSKLEQKAEQLDRLDRQLESTANEIDKMDDKIDKLFESVDKITEEIQVLSELYIREYDGCTKGRKYAKCVEHDRKQKYQSERAKTLLRLSEKRELQRGLRSEISDVRKTQRDLSEKLANDRKKYTEERDINLSKYRDLNDKLKPLEVEYGKYLANINLNDRELAGNASDMNTLKEITVPRKYS